MHLTKWGDVPSGNYSGGMKRRLSVAIALIGSPKIVFLDGKCAFLAHYSGKTSCNSAFLDSVEYDDVCVIMYRTHNRHGPSIVQTSVGSHQHGEKRER